MNMPGASSINETIDSDNKTTEQFDKLVPYVFRMLYMATDVKKAINLLLEIIGKKFDVSRAYIFEDTQSGMYTNNTFEWCNSGIVPEKDLLQNVSYAELGDYYANFNEDNIFYCNDIKMLPKGQRELLEKQSVKSLLQCVFPMRATGMGLWDSINATPNACGQENRSMRLIS